MTQTLYVRLRMPIVLDPMERCWLAAFQRRATAISYPSDHE